MLVFGKPKTHITTDVSLVEREGVDNAISDLRRIVNETISETGIVEAKWRRFLNFSSKGFCRNFGN